MRHRSGTALVRLVLLGALVAAFAGCGNLPTSPTAAPPPHNPWAPPADPGPPFKLGGNVSTATGQSLPGATVEATWATGSASTVSVGGLGSKYELSIPVAGDVIVRATMDGYDTQEVRLTINAHTHLDIPMPRTLPSAQYRLTFTASPTCSLPAEIARREYTAGLQVDASGQATVYLRAGTMLAFMGEAGFTGVREGDILRFQVSDDEMGPYAFVEFLDGYRWLGYSGTITGRIDSNRIDATFNGRVQLVGYPAESVVAQCTAADHRMEFVR